MSYSNAISYGVTNLWLFKGMLLHINTVVEVLSWPKLRPRNLEQCCYFCQTVGLLGCYQAVNNFMVNLVSNGEKYMYQKRFSLFQILKELYDSHSNMTHGFGRFMNATTQCKWKFTP